MMKKRDKKYSEHIASLLVEQNNEDGLREICRKFDLSFDKSPGVTSKDKMSFIVRQLIKRNEISTILSTLSTELPMDKKVSSKRNFFKELFKILEHSSEEKSRKQKVKRKHFLEAVFEPQSIAWVEALTYGWEFWITRLLAFFFPEFTKRRVTNLSRKIKRISFLRNYTSCQEEMANYHSVRSWYFNLRIIGGLLSLILLFFFIPYFLGKVFAVPLSIFNIASLEDTVLYLNYEPSDSEIGSYFVQLKSINENTNINNSNYIFKFSEPVSSFHEVDFSEKGFQSIKIGQTVSSNIGKSERHLFRLDSEVGGSVIVEIDQVFAETDMEFTMLDSEMKACDSTRIMSDKTFLLCDKEINVPLFISVEIIDENLQALISPYRFSTYLWLTEVNEQNETNYNAVPIRLGTLFSGNLPPGDQDWFELLPSEVTEMEMYFSFSGTNENAVSTLFQKNGDSNLEAVGYGRFGMPEERVLKRLEELISTVEGRSIITLFAWEIFGITVDDSSILSDSLISLYIILVGIVTLYIVLVKNLSLKRFHDTTLVSRTSSLLSELDKKYVVSTEPNRARLRGLIDLVAGQISELHSMSWFPFSNSSPRESHKHFDRMSSQVSQMKTLATITKPSTINVLQQSFEEWFYTFLSSEYGEFQFQDDFEYQPLFWRSRIFTALRLNFGKLYVGIIFLLVIVFVTRQFWLDNLEVILAWIWLGIRYSILVTDVTQRRHQPEKQAEAAAIHEKPVARQINTTGFSTDNGFSWFALLTTQF